jgi:hypothetical protein
MSPHLVENIFKYGLLIATSPIWWPILRTLWDELQYALWREGGLIGRPPTPEEVPQLEKRYRNHATPFLNETFAEVQRREKLEDAERVEARRRGPTKKGKAAAEPSASVRPAARRAAGSTQGRSRPRTSPVVSKNAAGRQKSNRAGGGAPRGGGLKRTSGGGGFGKSSGGSSTRRSF